MIKLDWTVRSTNRSIKPRKGNVAGQRAAAEQAAKTAEAERRLWIRKMDRLNAKKEG